MANTSSKLLAWPFLTASKFCYLPTNRKPNLCFLLHTFRSSDVLLAGIDGGGEDHVLSVWQWDNKAEKAPLLGRVATRGENLRGVTFHPLDNHLVITFGKGHLVFWNRRKDGFFDRNDLVEDER